MTEKVAYLDSSAIVKRYVYETGSEFIRTQYNEVYLGNVLLSFNVWNIGEVIGVFDRAHRQKRITREQLDEVMGRFSNETARLKKISRMREKREKRLLPAWTWFSELFPSQAWT